ncbi:ABC transporter substrate-binding protein [Nonomuraea sp. NPDC050556]|uniref:ABC transporter substrate-binding protein n=1 Tax=Nonomuraea sp. NPDC050556 TaxID=3364369 RepID=UPI0037A1B8DD
MKRRTFLGAVAASALAGCARPQPKAVPAGPPRRGGRLRVGMVGAGKSESFNPSGAASAMINMAMTCAVFDSLVDIGPNLEIRPALATRWTPDKDARTWTFTLRQGVTWHDGRPLTAKDVLYTLRWMADPENQLSVSVANVDLDRVRAAGPHTIVVPLKSPDLLFPQTISSCWVVQDGATDFGEPVGTGPFVFASLDQGQQSVCRRNPAYWEPGKPYVDELVIQSIDDNTARVNALLGGQIDVLAQMPYTQARAHAGNGIRLLDSPSVAAQAFYMAVDRKPFDDVRVRQAMRLLVDRRQLVDVALFGFGTVANDLFGKGLEFYADTIPQRTRDVRRARELLAQAGYADGLTVTLETAAAAPGMVEAATLFAQQAKDGGVTINVSQVDATSYFDPTLQYLRRPFAQTFWAGFANLGSFYQYAALPDGYGNETHWTEARTGEQIAAATAASREAQAAAAWQAVQQEQWDTGGYIWWANVNNLDATSNRVAGITPSRYLSLGLPSGLANAYFTA